jgi:hypothetical protein
VGYEKRCGVHTKGGADPLEDIEVHPPGLPGFQAADGRLPDAGLLGELRLGPLARRSEIADMKAKRGHKPNDTRRSIIDATRLVV